MQLASLSYEAHWIGYNCIALQSDRRWLKGESRKLIDRKSIRGKRILLKKRFQNVVEYLNRMECLHTGFIVNELSLQVFPFKKHKQTSFNVAFVLRHCSLIKCSDKSELSATNGFWEIFLSFINSSGEFQQKLIKYLIDSRKLSKASRISMGRKMKS